MNQTILEKIFNKKHLASYWWYEALDSWKPTEEGNIQEIYTTAKL